jgi:hypothetical protein
MSQAILRLRPLDERILPSVTVTEAAGVVTVRGDQFNNTVVVSDNGTADPGAVTVTADGQTFTSQDAVTRIRIIGWNGADSVEYDLTGDLSTDRKLVVCLGNQDDTFTANLNGNVVTGGNLSLWVYAQNGEDTLTVGGTGGGVAADGKLDVRLFGGNGKDVVNVDLTGLWAGNVNVLLSGGNGTDTVSANLTAADGSTGTVKARVFGGNGVDTATLLTSRTTTTDAVSFDAVLCGGNGKDVLTSSDGVRVVDSHG